MKRPAIVSDTVLRVSTVIMASGVLLFGLKVAQDIFAPLTLAIVTGVIFAPLADRLERLGLPRGAVAMGLIVGIFFAIGALAYLVEPYITTVIDRLPSIKYEIRKLFIEYQGLIQGFDQMNKEVEAALGSGSGEKEATDMPGLTDAVFLAPVILAQMLIFLGGLFFFLLTRNEIYRYVSAKIGTGMDTPKLLERFCDAESMVSRYFAAISIVNAGLGIAVGTALMLLGLPGAVVWGIAAMLLNFVLYLGPAALAAGLLLAGVVNYDGLMTFAPMAIYLACNMTEAQFVTPALIGRHVQINPFLIFVSLVFWLWFWGPLGGIVAIPVTLILLRLFDILGDTSISSKPIFGQA
ncbi:AI-2E family transporter [Salipiger bermudensis]|uniref:AI-2E family transporter n=1 Tax=Salipiger bermudensis TaxID=344736 RepID=UPI001C99A667|nr:AI-2E family transporter [Salipiger bermudensis]MBY6003883.1 AI-2E family transporter [Salipiger bermudensis]